MNSQASWLGQDCLADQPLPLTAIFPPTYLPTYLLTYLPICILYSTIKGIIEDLLAARKGQSIRKFTAVRRSFYAALNAQELSE